MEFKENDLLAQVRNGNDLSRYSQIKLLIGLSIPSILAQISSIVMQYIDAAMVGRMGASESAAIGLVSTTSWLFGGLACSICAGYTVQVAHKIGAKDTNSAKEIIKEAILVVIMWTVLLAIIGAFISDGLPMWLGADASIHNNAKGYFLVYACSLPFMGLNSLAGGSLQCSGNMKIPGILNSLMCLLDVLFNALLIFETRYITIAGISVLVPGFGLGVLGAALGTALSEITIACLMLFFLVRRTFRLGKSNLRTGGISFKYFKKALKISCPVGFERLVVSGAMIATTRIVAPLGIVPIAANSFAITAEALCYMPGYGIAEAATTMVGQSIGAGRKKLAKSFGRVSTMLGMLLMTCTGIILFVGADFIMGCLSKDPEVINLGASVLRIEAFAEPMFAASIVVAGSLRGAGDTLVPSIMNFGSIWLVRIPIAYGLSKYMGLKGVWIAMCVELIFRGTIFLIRLNSNRWLKLGGNDGKQI